MPIHVFQWFVTNRIPRFAICFLIISDFNAILVSVAIPRWRRVFETVRRNIEIARQNMYLGQGNMIIHHHVCS